MNLDPHTSLILISGYGGLVAMALSAALFGFHFYPRFERRGWEHLESYVSWITSIHERMFRPLERQRVLAGILLSTFVFLLVGFYLSVGYGLITWAFTLSSGWIGWSIPRAWVNWHWQRRIRRFDHQLVDALNLMANSLKSGLNLNQVVQVLVEEMPNPIAQEFGLVISQQKLGLTMDEALEKMVDRIPSDDLAVAVHSVLILHETGGDLAETFETIANTIRERRKVDGKIKAVTMQGKTQGVIMFLLPFGLGGLLYYVNPGFLLPLFTTRIGWLTLFTMLFFQVLGGLWIKKIVTINV